MARKFNLPIIPIQNTRLNNGDIELSFHKPMIRKGWNKFTKSLKLGLYQILTNGFGNIKDLINFFNF